MTEDALRQLTVNGAVPAHIAIIMDGNGRWATERALPRPLGHRAGMKAVREVVEGALEAGVKVLTLFAFSQENWKRPPDEIQALMSLLEHYIAKEGLFLLDERQKSWLRDALALMEPDHPWILALEYASRVPG